MAVLAFDRWPVELILMIFQYLSGNDILLTFYNTSSHMNSVLKYYNNYSLNFLSITREKFDLILSYFELGKIFSLTLSNGELTGGQFGLFLSRYSSSFHLFTNLHCLTLHSIKIKKDEYHQLIEAFKQFKNLRWLHLNQISLAEDIDDRFTVAFRQLDSRCLVKLDHCEQLNIIPLSNRLQYWRSNCLYDTDNSFYRQQWPGLRTVKLKDLWRTSINHLLHLTPQLLSLTVECEIDKNTSPPNFRLVPNLRQLVFSSQNLTFNFLIVQMGLDTLSKLKQLEIRCNTSTDELLFDGHQWETFLSKLFLHLSKFDFYFKYLPQRNLSLNTFRTRFWLEEKQWFVALSICPYSNNLELFTVPHFNTTMKTSHSIIETTSPSFEHLNSNVHALSNSILIDKNNNYDISLGYHRYEHIEKFDFIIQDKFHSSLCSVNKLNCFLNLKSIKIVKLDVLCGWIVNYQELFDLLDHMPNLFKLILDTWPKKESWLQINKINSRVTSISLPCIHKVNDGRLPSGLKLIFSHVFSSIQHVHLRIHYPELCYQFDKYSLPWDNLSSLQIEYLFTGCTEDDQERRCHEWKEKLLNEVLLQQSRRNFTFVDIDNKLSIWFGEILNSGDEIEQNDQVVKEEMPLKHRNKKMKSCFQYRKCLLS